MSGRIKNALAHFLRSLATPPLTTSRCEHCGHETQRVTYLGRGYVQQCSACGKGPTHK